MLSILQQQTKYMLILRLFGYNITYFYQIASKIHLTCEFYAELLRLATRAPGFSRLSEIQNRRWVGAYFTDQSVYGTRYAHARAVSDAAYNNIILLYCTTFCKSVQS